jgi:hypothetical protein
MDPAKSPNKSRMAYLRVFMIRVSQATQAPVSRPNRRRLAYLREGFDDKRSLTGHPGPC